MSLEAPRLSAEYEPPPVYSVVDYNGIEVCWLPELDGGGRGFGQEYLPVVRHLFGKVGRVFEFCAGPAFIGFSLLAHGLCDSLAVADVNPAAVAAARETVRRNGLADRVAVYLSDGLNAIPGEERWDLVVSNPPHFSVRPRERPSLITDDLGWQLHRDFYARVGQFIATGGSILMQENFEGSTADDFVPMLEENGLEYIRSLTYTGDARPNFYFLWAKKAHEDIVLHGAPVPVSLDLADDTPPFQVASGRLLRPSMHNVSHRTVHPRVEYAAGDALLWLRLDALAPGERLPLPRLVLSAGDYVVRDGPGGNVVCRIRAEER